MGKRGPKPLDAESLSRKSFVIRYLSTPARGRTAGGDGQRRGHDVTEPIIALCDLALLRFFVGC
jgi:hypothetical protein